MLGASEHDITAFLGMLIVDKQLGKKVSLIRSFFD